MNYNHGFHAGNFADVVKHALLARILVHLREKETPFRVIDTHAGGGLYDLDGPEASRTGEWRSGIGALLAAMPDGEAGALLAPYFDVIAAANEGRRSAAPHFYPGSPLIAAALMRRQDRLTACELEPKAAAGLRTALGRDRRVKAIEIDGWTALNAYVPPVERRGVVVVDPPFEQDDFARLPAAVAAAHRKWATGIFLVWYPIKARARSDALGRDFAALEIGKMMRVEMTVKPESADAGLVGGGLIVVNAPWRLSDEARTILSALVAPFGEHSGHQAGFRIDQISA